MVGLDLTHLPTAARIDFDNHPVSRFHVPVKRKHNLCINFKLSASVMNLDFLTRFCVHGVAPSIMREIHVFSADAQRTQG